MKVCCFIGHRNIEISEELVKSLKEKIKMLICTKDVTTFIFGSRSKFDDLCLKIVTELKNDYPFIKRVCMLCRHEACVLECNKLKEEKMFSSLYNQEVHLLCFDEELEFKNKFIAGKASYVERNQAMIDMSDFCIFYFDKNYLPPKRKLYNRVLLPYQPKSGTAIAYKYAEHKKKIIINMFDIVSYLK